MTSPHQPTDQNPLSTESAGEKHSRLLWWMHPKVALPLTLLSLLLVAPFLYRGYCISSVPDIGDPFDVEAFGTVNIAPIDNAMTHYSVAMGLLRKAASYSSEDLKKAFDHGWSQTPEVLRKWLSTNQPALAEWRKGTERSQAVFIQPKDRKWDSIVEVIQESAQFTRLARLQAEHCAYDGDRDAAWGWLLAVVRASRHFEQYGCFVERLTGIATFHSAAVGIERWAENPGVTADLLQKALAEFREADQLTPPNSVVMKAEYLVLKNMMKHSESLLSLVNGDTDVPWQLHPSTLFLRGEPEYSRRAFQHVFRNQLSEIDKLKWDRAPIAGGTLRLYDLPTGAAPSLPARDLERVVRSAVFPIFMLPAYADADAAMQREASRRAAVSLLLACQFHHRLHGDWPAKVEDLVPNILAEPPTDPLGNSGELMRLKRDGDDLVIYSVGLNGVDDSGNIGDAAGADRNEAPDQGVRAKRPTSSPNPLPTETTPLEKN